MESKAYTEILYVQSEIQDFGVDVYNDIYGALSDVGLVLLSIYNFFQNLLGVVLSSPLLTTIIGVLSVNPMILAFVGLVASDPLMLINNYAGWQSEVSSRSAKFSSNFGQMYTFISIGLPRLEGGLLGVASGIASVGNGVVGNPNNAPQQQIFQLLSIYPVLLGAELSMFSSSTAARPTIQLVAGPAQPLTQIYVNPRADSSSAALPAGNLVQRQFTVPTVSGNGQGNINIILGGGIFPTITLGGMLAGSSTAIAGGVSGTIGVGGGSLPTGLVGAGAGVAANPSNVAGQVSGTVSEGGWMPILPEFNAGGILVGSGGFSLSSSLAVAGGVHGGGQATIGYGGIFMPMSNLAIGGGGNIGFNILVADSSLCSDIKHFLGFYHYAHYNSSHNSYHNSHHNPCYNSHHNSCYNSHHNPCYNSHHNPCYNSHHNPCYNSHHNTYHNTHHNLYFSNHTNNYLVSSFIFQVGMHPTLLKI
ncbi:hypothetical protein GQ54DRAFT_309962 [Martensiomyces pterosporus]|nr:hypothetical protein GQ54DRAFT_309962 [Martensiomyces pterosporus]